MKKRLLVMDNDRTTYKRSLTEWAAWHNSSLKDPKRVMNVLDLLASIKGMTRRDMQNAMDDINPGRLAIGMAEFAIKLANWEVYLVSYSWKPLLERVAEIMCEMGLRVTKIIGTEIIFNRDGVVEDAEFLGNKLEEAKKYYPIPNEGNIHPVVIIDDAFSSFGGMMEAELAIAFGPTELDRRKFMEEQGKVQGKLVILSEKNLECAADIILEYYS